jgi:hypothetical protein
MDCSTVSAPLAIGGGQWVRLNGAALSKLKKNPEMQAGAAGAKKEAGHTD